MRFNYFRILITILASFGAFLAYMCRLNLSLAIEEMTFSEPMISETKLAPVSIVADNQVHLGELSMKRLHSEEHTLAQLSIRPAQMRMKMKLSSNKKQKRNNFTQPSLVAPLAIELDVGSAGQDKKATTTAIAPPNNLENDSGELPGQQVPSGEVIIEQPENLLHWNKEQKNQLLGVFFLGYVIFQIPGGRAAEIFGAKAIFLWLALGTGCGSLAFPYAARLAHGSILWAAVVRFVIGASQAAMFPACYVLLCKWLPQNERSSWLAVPSASGRIGTIVMNLIVPIILKQFGWEMVFYVSGGLTLIWGLLFLVLASDSPQTSRWISSGESYYIESRMSPQADISLANQKLAKLPIGATIQTINTRANNNTLEEQQQQRQQSKSQVPAINWLKMITNRPLLVLTYVMFTSEWSNMLLLIKLPGFLGPALKMGLMDISLWSSVFIAVYCVHYPLSGYLASRLEQAQIDGLSSLRVRKLFEFTAHILQALACLTIAFFEGKTIVLVALFVMMVGRSTVGGGQCLMPPELSKDYPGSVMALANSIANLAGYFGPMLVNVLVEEPDEYESWRNLWLVSAGIFFSGALVFCLFAQNEQQNFSRKPKDSKFHNNNNNNSNNKSISQANLVQGSLDSLALPGTFSPPKPVSAAEEIIKMDSFSRVASEPSATSGRQNRI